MPYHINHLLYGLRHDYYLVCRSKFEARVQGKVMSTENENERAPMPWQALARLILALILGLAAFLYAFYRIVIGDQGAGIVIMLCTLVGARALAGPWIYIYRK